MKKILIDARESGESTGRYVDKLIEYLHKLKSDYDFVVITKPHRVEFIKKIAPRFQVVESTVKEFTLKEQTWFLKQVLKFKPDLVHFAIVHQPILYLGKVVTTMHDLTTARYTNPSKNWLVFKIKQMVYIWVNRIVAHKSKAIFTPTEFIKDDVAKFARVNSRKITVTPESADSIQDNARPIKELRNARFIMYVGRPLPHKNLGRLIEAFALLKEKYPELKLALVGKKHVLHKQHEKLAKKLGVAEDVMFTGFVSEGELRWLYENTAAYIFPSLSEGFGLPGLEAMIHSAPVVSSNATCLPEVYGTAAQYFDPESVEDMAKAIGRVLGNEKRRSELIAAGKKQAAKYSWAKMAEQTLAVYEEVLDDSTLTPS